MTRVRAFRFAAVVLAVGALSAGTAAAPARDPAIYGHVSHLGWVVRDVDATVAFWRNLGVSDVAGPEEAALDETSDGGSTTVRVRRATARFANGRIEWIQPMTPGSSLGRFLSSHGEGVHHVAYAVPDETALQQEVEALGAVGVSPLVRGGWKDGAGPARFVWLDTAGKGAVSIALAVEPASAGAAAPSNGEPFAKITQYAFVVRDVHAVSAYYERLGFPPLSIERNVSLDRVYRGKPAGFEMLLGWGRLADIVFEWIQPTIGPNVYDEYLAQHGEGLHHLAFNVPDMDRVVAALTGRGLVVTMSGGWNVNGSEGRFAYLDTERVGGVTIELLWNKPRP